MRATFRLISTLLLALTASAQMDEKGRPVHFPDGYKTILDQTYVKVGDWEGKMDIYTPPIGKTPTPVVLRIHGGGWDHGNKVQGGGVFAQMGFAVVNVEYRFTQVAPAPAALEDTRCALRFVVGHARELNIDPSRIVLEGGSAGGYLALMTGLLGDDRRFDGNCPGHEDMKVAAIVDEFGPSDFTPPQWDSISKTKSVVKWLGPKGEDERFRRDLSPVTYVTKQSPPVIIIHGEKDPTVPIEQSKVLEEALKRDAVKTEMIVIPNGGHGGFAPDGIRLQNESIEAFLKSVGVARH